MRAKEYLSKYLNLGWDYGSISPLSSPRGIMTRDRWDTIRSDVMLLNLLGADRVSIGSMIEVGWADAARVPIVLVMEESGNPHEHAMVAEAIGFRVGTLEQGVAIVKALVLPGGTGLGPSEAQQVPSQPQQGLSHKELLQSVELLRTA